MKKKGNLPISIGGIHHYNYKDNDNYNDKRKDNGNERAHYPCKNKYENSCNVLDNGCR